MKFASNKMHSIVRLFLIATMLVACKPETSTPAPLTTSVPTSTSTPTSTPIPTSTPTTMPSSTPAVPPASGNYPISPPLRPRKDTWLQVLGAPDNMAGSSVVSLGNSIYAVAAGFTPGLPNDFGLLRFNADGQVQSQRYTSEREHAGSLAAQSDDPMRVKALGLQGGKISLAFDTVWLPEVGQESSLSGWQVSLGSYSSFNTSGLVLTDLVKAGEGFFLRAAVGRAGKAHLAILKVRPNGAVDWAVEYPEVQEYLGHTFGDVSLLHGGKMFLTEAGELLTGGYLRTASGQEQAVVLWLNQDGALLRSVTVKMQPFRLYKGAGLDNSRNYQDMALLPNGDIILVQDFSIDAHGNGGALITRLAPNGAHMWTIGLHALSNIGGSTFVSEIRQEGDQLILVGGSTAFEAPEGYGAHVNMMMASLDSSGQPVWIRSLGAFTISVSANEFKTDYATAFLPTGDGRMIITGTSDSFGSRQTYDGAPYIQHYDLLLGMVGLGNGGIQGASNLMWSPDLNDKYKVWADPKAVTLGTCSVCNMQLMEGISLVPVTYTAEGLELVKRDLDGGMPENRRGLQFSALDKGRGLISSRTFFSDPLQDLDHDGLDQDWENAALEQVKPIIELDEEELWLKNRDRHHVALLTRVTPWPAMDEPDYILFEYAVTWSMDYGAKDFVQNHRGDVELVTLAWRVETERSLRLEWVFTSAHGGASLHEGVWNADDATCNRGWIADSGYLSITDAEPVGTELMCDTLRFKNNRVWLQASENKHALYPTPDICEYHATLVAVLGKDVWGEDCGGGGEFLFEAYNIGEPDPYLIENLGNSNTWTGLTESQQNSLRDSMFFGEFVTAGNSDGKFCGGLQPPPDECPGPIAGKLKSPPGILAAKLGPTTYRVSIKTRDILLAGTDAGVHIVLYAEDGKQLGQMLDGSFERDSLDIFHIGNPSTYIGDIVKIGLKRNDNESNPDFYIDDIYGYVDLSGLNPTADWNVGDVQVENKVTGNKWTFTINEDLTNNSEHVYWPDAGE